MIKRAKKIIAREGLIFLPYFSLALFVSYSNCSYRRFRYDDFFMQLFLWLFVYGAIRFFIWAIKTLREK